jgi:acyl carrier protein
MPTIEDRVKHIIADQVGRAGTDIRNDQNLDSDLDLDSLDLVEIGMGLEEEFNCEIPDERALGLTTVQSVIDLVNEYQPATL